MKQLLYKYNIHGRTKGRKKIQPTDNFFIKNYEINLKKDIKKNKKNIIDIGSGSGENTLFLAKKNRIARKITTNQIDDNFSKLRHKYHNRNQGHFKTNPSGCFPQFVTISWYWHRSWVTHPL